MPSLFFLSFEFDLYLQQNMNFVGIDMSKDSFHAAFDAASVEVFANTKQGIRSFLKRLVSLGCLSSEIKIGVEATGAYHLLLAETLRQKGWPLFVINPLLTSRLNKTNLRQVKNDRVDALSIRKAVLLGHGYRYTDTPEILRLKTLVQERLALRMMRTTCKGRQHAHEEKQRALPSPLPGSFESVERILTEEIKILEEEMDGLAQDTQALLRSIPGIGKLCSASLVAYISDIHRFESPEKLTAYIGLDCRIYQSGTSVHGKGYLTKRGNKYLRSLLFNAAFIAKRWNPDLKRFFEKKLKEGKHHYVALCAVERKLVHLIYAVWKRGTPYELRERQI